MIPDHFEADDRCMVCKKMILTEHEIFLFYNSPDDIKARSEEEWRPNHEQGLLPFDNGPNRVAYVWRGDRYPSHMGDAVVSVHEGPLAEVPLWVPCGAVSYTMSHSPGVWMWICQPISPKNPIDDDWLRGISS
jgi:hypothetical protein